MGKEKKLLKAFLKIIKNTLDKKKKKHHNKHHHHHHHHHHQSSSSCKDNEVVQQQPPPSLPQVSILNNQLTNNNKRKISSTTLNQATPYISKKRNINDNSNTSNIYGGLMNSSIPKPNQNISSRIRDSLESQKSSEGVTRKLLYDFNNKSYTTPQECYSDFIKHYDIVDSLQSLANDMQMIKFFINVRSIYTPDESSNEEDEISIYSRSRICQITKFNSKEEITQILESIFNQISEEQDSNHPQSGLSFLRVNAIEIYITKFRIIRGSCFIPLPPKYQGYKCFINIMNEDNQCFKWAVLAALYSCKFKYNKDHIEKYLSLERNHDWDMLNYPVDATDYKKINEFEEKNQLNVNIYYIDIDRNDNNKETFIPIRLSKQKKELKYRIVNLLLLKNDYGSHYVAISSLDDLFRRMINKKSNNSVYVCPYCLFYTYDLNTYNSHINHDCQDKENILRLFPNMDDRNRSTVKFKHWTHLQMIPVTLYYDTETYFEPYENELIMKRYKNDSVNDEYNEDVHVENRELTKTEKSIMSRHQLYSYCIYVDSKIPDIECCTIIKCKTNYDHNIEKEFVDDIINIYNQILMVYNYRLANPKLYDKNPVTLNIHNQKTKCDFCGKLFNNTDHIKVLHHDHFTGKYIASICSKENLNIDIKNLKIPVIAHNAMKYDQHFIIRELAKIANESEAVINIIPNTDENYKCIEYKNLIFIDSYLFLSGSLANLTNDLKITSELNNDKKVKFKSIYENFKYYNGKQINDEIIEKYLLQKNYFPYEHMTSLESFEENFNDLTIDDFKSRLNDNESIKQEEFDFAMEVNEIFNFKNIREYNLFYLQIDVYVLQSVFNDFRENIFNTFNIDPCWYISLPSLSLDLFLHVTDVELQLFCEPSYYDFILKGLYGGLSYIGKRKEEANNKFMKEYDESLPNKYLLYQDYNSLYPSVMASCKMPLKDFEFIEPESISLEAILDLPYYEDMDEDRLTTDDYGYILEVDIELPVELQDKFKEYPLLPERKKIPKEWLSKIQIDRAIALGIINKERGTYHCTEKLITDLYPKEKYVIHYQNLKFAVQHGYRVSKVYRIMRFVESLYMGKYINTMVEKRVKAKENNQNTTADYIKKLMNSLYGKFMERVEKRSNILLITNEKQMIEAASDPWFKDFIIIEGDLRIAHFYKKAYIINKPIQIGMVILELSKLKMQKYWYDVLDKKYGSNKLTLCMTDTDSLLFSVETEDIFSDLEDPIFNNWIDGSNLKNPALSNYNLNIHTAVHPGTLNRLKFEEQDKNNINLYVITKFIGLKSKCYVYEKECVNDENQKNKTDNRCKGINVKVSRKITYDVYNDFVEGASKSQKYEVCQIKSIHHNVYTTSQNKTGLTYYDDKRLFLDNYNTVPYGYKIN